jgi:hypothetical protein
MNVWEIEFEVRWSKDAPGVFSELHQWVHVVAPDYDSALETARQEVAAISFDDDEDPDVVHVVKNARLISIKRGIEVDAIAKVAA